MLQDINLFVDHVNVVNAEADDIGALYVVHELTERCVVHFTADVRVIVYHRFLGKTLYDVVIAREKADKVSDIDYVLLCNIFWEYDHLRFELSVECIARVIVLIQECHSNNGLQLFVLQNVLSVALIILEELDCHVTNEVLAYRSAKPYP